MKRRRKKRDASQRTGDRRQKGVALVMALIITLVIFLLIGSTIYLILQATKMSGAGKRYATAAEAADGAVEVMKDAIRLIMYSQPVSDLPIKGITTPANAQALVNAVTFVGSPITVYLDLPGGDLSTWYTAQITLERLYQKSIPGGRIEFARSAGGAGSNAIFYRINTVVTGPNNTKAETTALFRFVG